MRGPRAKVYSCYCKACRRTFLATREDAQTCSPRCRKAWNRLMAGDNRKRKQAAVTDPRSDQGDSDAPESNRRQRA
jgi:hypothetical protein